METEPPKNKIEDDSDNESEEKSEKKSDMETKDNLIITLDKKSDEEDNQNDQDDEDLEIFSEKCDLLKMITVPTFGKYSNDYTFLEQVLILKSKSKFENIPEFIKKKLETFQQKHPKVEPEYFHITLGNLLIKNSNEKELNDSFECLNLLCHPYIFYNCTLEKEHRSEIYCAAFTDENEIGTIKQANGNDILRVNPECDLDDHQLKREIILHLSNDGYASLSPNNCAIFINMNSQITNFYIIVCGTYGGEIVKCFVGNYVIIPNANNIIMFKDLYVSMTEEKQKKSLAKELIILKNKFREYMDYVFNFGINEILKINDLKSLKLCIMRAFSYIFYFDDDSKKNLEKELTNIQSFYYYNFINFVGNLYELSTSVDPNFAEKFVEICLNNKYIEELLIKYRDYSKTRFDNIISKYLLFIYENDDALDDIEEKTNEDFEQDILPNLKEFFCDKLESDEDNLEEIKSNFNEENRNHKDNPNIEILINICNTIRNEGNINDDLNQLDEIVRKYLFYVVWDYKGRPQNVHSDFGRVSFMNIEIDGKYYCNKEDQINCCQKIIQFLEKADGQNYN